MAGRFTRARNRNAGSKVWKAIGLAQAAGEIKALEKLNAS